MKKSSPMYERTLDDQLQRSVAQLQQLKAMSTPRERTEALLHQLQAAGVKVTKEAQ